ncbi:hypothetical protein GCM10009416_39570 [Craurococcus roseus]|uniref:Uncharacterized protein n=1 Tax=Craurococcus roseus TaxID=77585 RepID=A0ABN1FTF2_9PROT
MEWPFLPVLERTERGPKSLRAALAADLALFARMLGFIYPPIAGAARADVGDDEFTPEQPRTRGMNAHRLLEGWRRPLPGRHSPDSTFSSLQPGARFP